MSNRPRSAHYVLILGALLLCVLSVWTTEIWTPNEHSAVRYSCDAQAMEAQSVPSPLDVALLGPCATSSESSESRLNYAALTGDSNHWIDSCDAERLDWCTQALRARHIQLQYDLLERIQNPNERAQALQTACIDPVNAEAIRQLLQDEDSVDTLFLEGCYMSTESLQLRLHQALDRPDLRTTALLLLAANQMPLPDGFQPEESPLLSHWLMSSRR